MTSGHDVNTASSAAGSSPAAGFDRELAKMIDHTLLKPDATEEQIRKLCDEAGSYEFASVCVNPCHVVLCADLLRETPVQVCTVIGFPLGANTTAVKVAESRQALADGATELDMVLNVGMLKSGKTPEVKQEIAAVVAEAKAGKAITKIIIETALLTGEEKVLACRLAVEAGADFVKASTGFAKGGATTADVALMRRTVGTAAGVKASGGIRSYEDAIAMIRSGATRIGTSSGVAIVTGAGSAQTSP
jgi:deoxyribose-phosphate aldolase